MTRGSTRRWRALRAQVLTRDGGLCVWCGAPASHVDHLVPVAHGGPDVLDNLVAACAWCNRSRGATRTRPRHPRPQLGRQSRAW